MEVDQLRHLSHSVMVKDRKQPGSALAATARYECAVGRVRVWHAPLSKGGTTLQYSEYMRLMLMNHDEDTRT